MRTRTRNKVFVYWTFLAIVVLNLFILTECKGSGSGGGGGGRGGGTSFGGRGARAGRSSARKGAIIAAGVGGVAGYAAYKASSHTGNQHRFHSNPLDNPAYPSGGGGRTDNFDYKIQESTYYSRREGFGMSAFGLLALILGIIGAGTLAWYCYMIGIPLWKDRKRRSMDIMEGHPLQETPSTATPSP